MSTDWGFACETCGRDDRGFFKSDYIVDNCRDQQMLAEVLACTTLHAALNRLWIEASTSIFTDLVGALRFAEDHKADGHVVRVCNEYGTLLGEELR